MATAGIYLHFNGNCEQAFNRYKAVFGKEFVSFLRYCDTPIRDNVPSLSESDLSKIENIAIQLSDALVLMGSDMLPSLNQNIAIGNNFSIYLEAKSKEEAEMWYSGLSEAGVPTMPMAIAHWGGCFGMCVDKFGISWMVSYTPKTD